MIYQPYVYLFVRSDLSTAQKIIQVAHAIEEMTKRTAKYYPSDINLDVTNFMVLFSVTNERDLLQAADYLDEKGIVYENFFEPDIQSHTAIATEPLAGARRRPLEIFMLME
jgi:hypothetical protein